MKEKKIFDLEMFSEKVLLHRHRCRLSLRAAAKQIGISASTLNRLENRKMPDVETFFRICKWIILPTDYFLIGTPIKNNVKPKERMKYNPDFDLP